MKSLKYIKYSLLAATISISSCADLDVVNPNDPSASSINSETLRDLASGALYNVFNGYTSNPESGNVFNANVHLAWTADHTASTNNYRSMWSQFKVEDRVQFNNSLTFPDLEIISDPWQNWHGAIGTANVVISQLQNAEDDASKEALALAYMAKGLALGHLAGTFDQAYLVPVDADVTSLDPKEMLAPYHDILAEALLNLDAVIDLVDNGLTFVTDSKTLNGISYNQDQFARLANSYAAHFALTTARNRTQASQTDYSLVKNYAEKGIQQDFILQNEGIFYLHDFQFLNGLFWYFRIDHRVLRHFNPNYPKRFSLDATASIPEADLKGAGYNGDKRLDAYFEYSADLSFFNLSRGPQLRTHYFYPRNRDLYDNNGVGPAYYMYKVNNDLMLAEAELRLGNKTAALAILNDPTYPRKAIGEMPDIDVGISDAELLELIFAERDIELARTVFGLEHFDMRRQDKLQIGSILHFPVPADELTTIGLPIYTYGGVANADGENTADGSNSWLNN